MASNGTNGTDSQLLVVGDTGGVTVVDRSTPLRRLNYFDGKFLRASDFSLEQYYLRELVALSNQGLGWGVVYGYDTVLGTGDNIQIGPGLAIDPAGKVLLMQATVTQSIQALIDASKKSAAAAPDASGKAGPGTFSDCITVAAPPPTTVVAVSDLYVIAICSAEALCGQADVYGKLCEEACVTSTDRPYRLDGIVLKAIPVQLITAFPTSKAVAIDGDLYLRSKVAYSFYRDEVAKHPSAISRDGLLSNTWCLGAGYDSSCCEVPLAVVARSGATTVFLDAWIARRERIDMPARRYWQWKMMMRPWNVFLAQVLQFQCQLAEVLSGFASKTIQDPSAAQNQALGDALKFIEDVRVGLSDRAAVASAAVTEVRPLPAGLTFSRIADLKSRFEGILKTAAAAAVLPATRILISGGIIELPASGYLPIVNGSGAATVNSQVRALLGEGLDLRFCIVTPDYAAHVFEEAQHMDRISLLQGIDDATRKPKVDILVPDGNAITSGVSADAKLYHVTSQFSMQQSGGAVLEGVAREEALPSAGTALYLGGAAFNQNVISNFARMLRPVSAGTASLAELRLTPDLRTNEFIRNNPTLPSNFAARLSAVAKAARARTVATTASAVSRDTAISAAVNNEILSGVWVTARTEKSIKDLTPFAQSQVSLRVITSAQPAAPKAFEIAVTGALTVTNIVPQTQNSPLTVQASLNLVVTISAISLQPAQEQEEEFVIIKKYNLNSAFSYQGDDLNGSITMDIFDPSSNSPTSPIFHVVKSYLSSPASAEYVASLALNQNLTQFIDLELTGDSGVINVDNHYHQLAEDGLDLVQAALVETEPSFKKAAEGELFPQLPAATVELTIGAVRDWVLFTKRREETCAMGEEPAPLLPPRAYRIINGTVSQDQVGQTIERLQSAATNPTLLAEIIAAQIEAPHVVIKFAGGSAQPLYDPAAAESDWKTLNPGKIIVAVLYGSIGDDDPILQQARAKQFENTISADSQEKADGSTVEIPVVPYPQIAVPPDADGVMIFVTTNPVELQHVYATSNPDAWRLLQGQIQNSTLNPTTLNGLTDLGLASTTGTGTGQQFDDAQVQSAFKADFAEFTLAGSMMISRSGDSGQAFNDRKALAGRIVTDLDSTASAPSASVYAAQLPIADANSILFLNTLPRVESQHVYATTDQNLWGQLSPAIQNGTLDATLLGRFTDLGVASSTGSGVGQKIDDTAVVNAFSINFPRVFFVQASTMISRQGDSGQDFSNRAAIATKIVTDITPTAPAPSTQTYPSQFPLTEANSTLFVLVGQEIL
jgi:hypothetical protein